jgi:hypothetical protein
MWRGLAALASFTFYGVAALGKAFDASGINPLRRPLVNFPALDAILAIL